MKPIVVICRNDSFYAREVVRILIASGHPPRLVLLGSRSENLMFNLRSFSRIRKQLGLVEAIRRIRRTRGDPAPTGDTPPIHEQARQHGFAVKTYDFINSGPMIVDLLEVPDAVAILAGCGIADRSLIHAARGGCVNGHPALLPGVRGVDVVEWALVEDRPIGVTAHHVAPTVDSGEIIRCEPVAPRPDESYARFNARLVLEQARVLAESALLVAAGEDQRRPNPTEKSVLRFAAAHAVHRDARRKFAMLHRAAPLTATPQLPDVPA